MFIKSRLKEHKILNITFIVIFFIILLIIGAIIYFTIENNNQIQTEGVDISDFSSTLEMKKEGKVVGYPEITILSNIDGEVLSLDVNEGDIVEEWQILMQIGNPEESEISDVDIDAQIGQKYARIYEKEKEYDKFQTLFGEEIYSLENKILQDNKALITAIEMDDEATKIILQKEIQEINGRLKLLKSNRDKIKSEIINIENELQIANRESIQYYYEQENHTPRATISGIIGNIYVKEGDCVKIGDKIATIVDNSFSSEIAVGLDFHEYLLTKDLSEVSIIAENENRGDLYYNGEIYSRSPILNEEGTYTVIIRFLEDVWDLVLNDENTKITVIFPVESKSMRIPERCFTGLSNNTGTLLLREGEVIIGKEVGIKDEWNDWINLDVLTSDYLEKEKNKNKILCRLISN